MAITKTDIEAFSKSFRKSTDKFIDTIELHSENTEAEIVQLKEDGSLSDEMEIMILAIKELARKAEINLYY